MNGSAHLHRVMALDILTRKPGRAGKRSNCAAVQRAIELLAASSDEDSACLVLLAITSVPALAEAICSAAGAPTPSPAAGRSAQDTAPEIARRFAGPTPAPAGDHSLIDLHIELERALVDLECADAIDDGPRWQREMEAARANIRRIEAAIDAKKRSAA